MATRNPQFSRGYFTIVLSLMFLLPLASIILESVIYRREDPIIAITGKWFIFWAIGIRLFSAGCKQALNPAFTAKEIFHLKNDESFILVKELGFANICLGAIGILSLFLPAWRMAAGFAGGMFLGIAGIGHIFKKPASGNEWIAMISDLFIFLVIVVYLFHQAMF